MSQNWKTFTFMVRFSPNLVGMSGMQLQKRQLKAFCKIFHHCEKIPYFEFTNRKINDKNNLYHNN